MGLCCTTRLGGGQAGEGISTQSRSGACCQGRQKHGVHVQEDLLAARQRGENA